MTPEFFAAYERQYGLPSGYLYRTAQIESSLNPRAQNPNSSAGGLFQFINSTARQYNLTDRFNPEAATNAAARLARDNAAYLRRRLGREPTAAELYMAHQQGAGGAYNLISGAERRASDIVGSAAVRLNGGNGGMTGAEFADSIRAYYGDGPSSVAGNAATPEPEHASQPQNALTGLSQDDLSALAKFSQRPRNALAEMGWRDNALDPAAFMSRRRF